MSQLQLPPRPVTPEENEDADKQLKEAVDGVYSTALDVLVDRPGFVASDDPVNPLSTAVRAVTRLNCRRWAGADKSGYSPRTNAYSAFVCDPYLESIGLRPEGGLYVREFDGGQCPVNYRASVSWTQADNGCSVTNASNPSLGVGPGPISLSYRNNRAGQNQPLCPGFSYNEVILTNANGDTVLVGSGRGVSLQSFSLTREDGQPDNCGDPPFKYQPPNTVDDPALEPGPINITLPGIGPVTVNVDLKPTGEPTVCIVETGNCFDVTFPEDGSEEGGGGDDGGGGPPPGDIGEPGGGGEAGPGGDAEGEAPDGSVLVGLQLTLTVIPEGARTYTGDIYRGPAYIYMGVPGNLDMDYAGSQLAPSQFVFAEKDNLTAWRVRANDGYVINVVPYYREIES